MENTIRWRDVWENFFYFFELAHLNPVSKPMKTYTKNKKNISHFLIRSSKWIIMINHSPFINKPGSQNFWIWSTSQCFLGPPPCLAQDKWVCASCLKALNTTRLLPLYFLYYCRWENPSSALFRGSMSGALMPSKMLNKSPKLSRPPTTSLPTPTVFIYWEDNSWE